MAELPAHLKAAQAQFLARASEQNARMENLHAQELASEIAEAEPTEGMSTEDFLLELEIDRASH